MRSKKVRLFTTVLMLWSLVINLAAQTGGDFAISKAVIGSGSQASSGGDFSVTATLGQAVAGDNPAGGDFAVGTGFWTAPVSGVGLEGDAAPRPNGDGSILSNDVVQVRRYLNATSVPDTDLGEFQRADSAPRATSGDGMFSSNDVVQTRRYQNGTDIQQPAAGPLFEGGSPLAGGIKTEIGNGNAGFMAPRELRVESTSVGAGQSFTLNIRVDAMGDEAEYGFRLNYQSAKLSNPVVGAGNAGAAVRACNTAAAGVVNCSVGAFPTNNPTSTDPGIGEINPGNDQILITVTFDVSANAASGPSPLTLTNVNTSNDNADLLPITATNGAVTILGPTAAGVAVGGRILTAQGGGIRNAMVSISGFPDGETRHAYSNDFGYFRFEEVPVGGTYILTVHSKRFMFLTQTRVITVSDELTDVNFTAEPEN